MPLATLALSEHEAYLRIEAARARSGPSRETATFAEQPGHPEVSQA
jgi:hypothetical protein